MLVIIIKIMVIAVLGSKLVDLVEEKGQRSLWVKLSTPLMWIAGEFFGRVAVVLATGVTPEQVTDPMFSFTPEGSNFFFLSEVVGVVGALFAIAALYLYARSLKTLAERGDTSFR